MNEAETLRQDNQTSSHLGWITHRARCAHMLEVRASDQDEERSEAGHEADDNSPASRVRQRYERMFKDRDNAEMMSDDAARAADAAREAANAAARTAFHGSIATVFTKHLRHVSVDCCGREAALGSSHVHPRKCWAASSACCSVGSTDSLS